MVEDEFWEIIETRPPNLTLSNINYLGPGNRVKYIEKSLQELPSQELVSFQNILTSKIRALYLLRVAKIFLSQMPEYQDEPERATFLSTDGFIDFRAWIICLGKKAYEGILYNKLDYKLIPNILNYNIAYEPKLPFLAENMLIARNASEYLDQIEHWYNEDLDLL